MSSPSEVSISSVPFSFKFGTTLEEMNDCFEKVGRILTVFLDSKLNDNFNSILNNFQPIPDIDEYLLKYNFDREVALRHKDDISLIAMYWLQDSTELRAESESALQSVVKVEEFVKFLEKQEYDFKSFVTKTVQIINNQDMDGRSDSVISITSLSTPSPPVTKVDSKTKESANPDVKSEVKLIMNVSGETMSYTLPKALEEIKKTKDFYEKHFFATKCLRNCIEILMAINESNKVSISRWNLSDTALKLRNSLWTNRKLENKQKLRSESKH